MVKKTILEVRVESVEKRRVPNKHYVYVIYVTWSDSTVNVIYRRYSKFFEFQSHLLDKFPLEAGTVDPADRLIPFLPGKILFGRSHIREVAMKRLKPIDQYCKSLVRLPVHISECQEVLDFFDSTQDDINPPRQKQKKTKKAEEITGPMLLEPYVAIADYKKEEKQEVSLTAGMSVEVIEKTETGWWFVSVDEEEGWVPSSYLQKVDGTKDIGTKHFQPGEEPRYVCFHAYEPQMPDEIKLDRGGAVDVIEKNLEGWWLVRYKGKEGWVPACYLTKPDTIKAQHLADMRVQGPVERINRPLDASNIVRLNPSAAANQNTQEQALATNQVPGLIDLRRSSSPGPARQTNQQSGNNQRKGSIPPSRPALPKNLGKKSSPVMSGSQPKSRAGFRSSDSPTENRKNPPPRRNSISVKPGPPRPAPPKMQQQFFTIADFDNKAKDGISFHAGQQVEVRQKNVSGWWYISIGGAEGWAPASYIEARNTPVKSSSAEDDKPMTNQQTSKPLSNRNSASNATNQFKQQASMNISKALNARFQQNNQQNHPQGNQIRKSNAEPGQTQSNAVPKSSRVTRNSRDDEDSDSSEWDSDVSDHYESRDYTNVSEAVVMHKSKYEVLEQYTKMDDTEVSLVKTEVVMVAEKSNTGWWYVRRDNGEEGWAPAAYLKPWSSSASSVGGTTEGTSVAISSGKPSISVASNRSKPSLPGPKPSLMSRLCPGDCKGNGSTKPKTAAKPTRVVEGQSSSEADSMSEYRPSVKALKNVFNKS